MLKTIKYQERFRRNAVLRHPIKLTALLYLKEALLKEQYENCKGIIAIAKKFGAADFEVEDLLEDPRRTPG